jgi:hypothetical protein
MSTVELIRETDGPELLEALAERGLKGELVGGQCAVQVEDCDEQELAHAIEDWLRVRELPFVPRRIDDCTFAIEPPGA